MPHSVDLAQRQEYLRRCLATFPDSVVPECYALGEPPEQVRLGELVGPEALRGGEAGDPVLQKFVRRLRQARPGLSEEELLGLLVPARAGDQEVYLARLGKWRAEVRALERSQES